MAPRSFARNWAPSDSRRSHAAAWPARTARETERERKRTAFRPFLQHEETSDMADKKIIAVVGSTGAQGGGLVEAILSDPNGGFAARAITRDPSKDKARALAARGAEVVKADLDDV